MNKVLTAVFTVVIVSLILGPHSAIAGELDAVVTKSAKINESAVKSQKKIDRIAEQIADKLQAFKSINKETDGLIVYNKQMGRQISNQNTEMERINTSMDEVSVIERQITPLMLRMISGLKEFINLDVPFLKNERSQRVQSLTEMMDRSDVAVSEKFRRVMEAYQIEVDYGRTIEAYTGNTKIEGKDQIVNFLRIGRTTLIYQTKDRKNMGIWDKAKRQWQKLDDSFTTQVTKGLRMAQKQLAPDMLIMPITAPIAKELGK